MLKTFLEYSKIFEKVQFREKFVDEIKKIENDKIANFLINYIENNDDDYVDWVELADLFTVNRLVITSKHNKPQVMKVTRFLRKIIPQRIASADEIDKFVNKILNKQIKETYFEIVKGDKIREAFAPENFLIKDGDLNNSCMSSETCLPFFDIYVHNKNVSALLLKYETKILARAIVWNALYSDRERVKDVPFIVMDKVYATSSTEEDKMIEYAKANDWLYFHPDRENFKDKNGKGYFGIFKVKLNKADFQQYPYVDNMQFLNIEQKELCNRVSDNAVALNQKDGTYASCTKCDGSKEILCPECDGTSTVNGENCTKCDGKGLIECPHCKE
jgi:hypothetical protein